MLGRTSLDEGGGGGEEGGGEGGREGGREGGGGGREGGRNYHMEGLDGCNVEEYL